MADRLQSRQAIWLYWTGNPNPPAELAIILQEDQQRISAHLNVAANPVLDGLHYEYRLVTKIA
jgi:hypothetical protein